MAATTGHHRDRVSFALRLVFVGISIILFSLFLLHKQMASGINLSDSYEQAYERILGGLPVLSQNKSTFERIEAELAAARGQIERLVGRSDGSGERKTTPGKTNRNNKPRIPSATDAIAAEREISPKAVPSKVERRNSIARVNNNTHPQPPPQAMTQSDPINYSEWPIWKRPFEWPAEMPKRQLNGNKFAERQKSMWMENKDQVKVKQRPYDPSKPMNVLLLYADDWRHDTLGAAGNKIVKTPTLDKLAKEGIRFTHNCVTTAVCWVSRVSMFSSQYLARHNSSKPKYWYLPWNNTVYDLMQENGYHVGHVGKWGVNHPFKNRPDFQTEEDGWHYDVRGGRIWHVTEKNEADALRFLEERPKDKPFFVNVAFFATHAVDGDKRQFLPQNKSMHLYAKDYMPHPVNNDTYGKLPYFFQKNNNEGRTRWKWRYDSDDKRQHMMKNYYRMASEVDSACALIMEEVRRQGELENTLIIFTTDNGNFHAEHGLADKWYPHEESIRVPLIIKDPRMAKEKAGTLNDEFTLNIDLAPTMLAAAGISQPKTMMGRDMAQLYLGLDKAKTPTVAKDRYLKGTDASQWRKEFFYEHPIISHKEYIPSSEALVRKDYKYFYWPDYDFEQLFRIKDDPREEIDLIKSQDQEVKDTLAEMRARFKELKQTVHNQTHFVIL